MTLEEIEKRYADDLQALINQPHLTKDPNWQEYVDLDWLIQRVKELEADNKRLEIELAEA